MDLKEYIKTAVQIRDYTKGAVLLDMKEYIKTAVQIRDITTCVALMY